MHIRPWMYIIDNMHEKKDKIYYDLIAQNTNVCLGAIKS